MLALREDVFTEWINRVRQTVKEAEQLPQPILINNFPSLYDNLAEAISPGFPRATANEGNTAASEHGGARARLTNYNAHSVISEHQLLRWTIFDVLKRKNVELSDDEVSIINVSIDSSIREAVNAFVLAQTALRQKFIAALTHDLRNPLSNAHVYAQLIQRSTESVQTKEFADSIVDSLGRIDGMIQELLDSASFHAGERLRLRLEELDLHEVLKEVCNQFAARHGPRFQLLSHTAKVWWDRRTIQRAVENIMDNAVKYGTPDTPILIRIDSVDDRTILSVHNEGEPLSADEMECVFQVLRRANAAKDENIEGWGIGLPYVRSVAESHGGSIGVDSAVGRGTTFVIDIPRDARLFQNAQTLG